MEPARRQFLRGDFSPRRIPARPPWALAEPDFQNTCERCSRCIGACPQGLIRSDRSGYPVIDFQHGGCTFCGRCREACDAGALADRSGARPWELRAVLDPGSCLSWHSVECRTCIDWCDAAAIGLQLMPGRPPRVRIEAGRCSGCGSCVAPCPTDAIRIIRENRT